MSGPAWSRKGSFPTFPDQGDQPEYNSVDASLWYIIAVHDFLEARKTGGRKLLEWQKKTLQQAVEAILTGYSQGTRFGIHMDQDGLLAAGIPGVQLTWMDSKIGDWVVTPRTGKPVEVQALWLNALWIASQFNEKWKEPFLRGQENFCARFWNEQGGYLYDVAGYAPRYEGGVRERDSVYHQGTVWPWLIGPFVEA